MCLWSEWVESSVLLILAGSLPSLGSMALSWSKMLLPSHLMTNQVTHLAQLQVWRNRLQLLMGRAARSPEKGMGRGGRV